MSNDMIQRLSIRVQKAIHYLKQMDTEIVLEHLQENNSTATWQLPAV